MQLRSLEAFLRTIEGGDELKDEVRLGLAKAVFRGGDIASLAAKKSDPDLGLAQVETLIKTTGAALGLGTAAAGREKAVADALGADAQARKAAAEARKAAAEADAEAQRHVDLRQFDGEVETNKGGEGAAKGTAP